mgnify:CR=1 FL=1|tara:strand:- start:431 stop:1093 length:663 start_codon:yes stop_codon:yes gene_type:complete
MNTQKFRKLLVTITLTGIVSLFSFQDIKAQVDVGADIMSRYVWRGSGYSNGPSIQPYMSYTSGSFEIGFWGAYANDNQADELDLYASYSIGPVGLTLTNYVFPNNMTPGVSKPIKYWASDGGWEGTVGLELGAIGLTYATFFDSGDTYIAASTSLGEEVSLTLGLGDGAYTTDSDFGLMEISLGYGKEIQITEDFALPASGNLIYNPEADQMYLVFGISL